MLKGFTDEEIESAKMTIFVFERIEKIEGKGEKCWLPALVVLSRDCVEKNR